jgi:NADH-quinone oxidoreductase subunit L
MYVPLVILATLAVVAGWPLPHLSLPGILEQARPLGTLEGAGHGLLLPTLVMPPEHLSHVSEIHVPVTLAAFGVALVGFLLAVAFYWRRAVDPNDVRQQFPRIYQFLRNKWWFDELYNFVFVRPTLLLARLTADLDRRGIDALADGSARLVLSVSNADDWIDRLFVDGLVNLTARWIHAIGLWLRRLQTGNLRQYVMFIVAGLVALFVLIVYWNYAVAGL